MAVPCRRFPTDAFRGKTAPRPHRATDGPRYPLYDDRFSLDSPTGALLNVYHAAPKAKPRGVLVVLHGLAEHAGRYARFAGEMAAQGFHVYAADHRGHGSTTAFDAPLRRFAHSRGAQKLVADVHAVLDHAHIQHHDLPVILFGHSMGGLIALNTALKYGKDLAGLAVWNANPAMTLQEKLAVLALKVEKALKGSDVQSDLFARATFEAWGKSVEPRRTGADWLSHDPAAVDLYLDDPLCGWTPTVSMAEDLIALVATADHGVRAGGLPASLPVHLLGGTADPATQNGQALTALAEKLRLAGTRNLTLTLVEGARHETLREIEPYRDQGLASLTAWLDRVLPR